MVVFPLICVVISFAAAVVLARDAVRKPRPDKIIWSIAFLMFALAASADAAGRELGWTEFLARLYYSTGPVLVVMFLAVGELYLLFPARMRRFGVGLIGILTAFWLSLVINAPIDHARLADDGWEAIERDGAMVAITVMLNTVATMIIVGGTGYSIWQFWKKGIMRSRMIGCAWILVGTLAVAAGGSLTRLGHYEYLYIAMSIGVAMIFWGVLLTRRPDVRPARVATPPPVAERREALVADSRGTLALAHDELGALLDRDAAALSAWCTNWSVPRDDAPVFSRDDARLAWNFRRSLAPNARDRFDALPVPVQRQVTTIFYEVLTWTPEGVTDGRPIPTR